MMMPTREQVAKFDYVWYIKKYPNATFSTSEVHPIIYRLADLECTIAEQAAEISILQSKADALADALTSIKNAQQSAVSFHDLRVFAAKAITTYKESKQ